jgi:AbrB family looped-hinge helix DNA binding protein
MPTATVTSKGQVTLPKEIRDALGIHPGDQIDFREEPDGRVFVSLKKRSLRSISGMLKPPEGVHATLDDFDRAIEAGWTRKGRK